MDRIEDRMKKYLKVYLAMVLCLSIMMLDILAIGAPFAMAMGDAKTMNEFGPWFVVGTILGLPILMALNALVMKFCNKALTEAM